ncbi:MAG: methylenetetrahydrofolate--tRNA-(uracil(54)-C(5))-methyltransferase (FADH(2)-oxidizing) TrmFO, partial [Actinomycetia bacterium]|nr:methylenetetrahydrofolate--tRNA-(uracil(54)-C(5))-methyltransferase (FADH(2)-oxidizing) TrmFO [Actinomycetes bacterium]
HTDQLAELVCSNSLKSTDPNSAPGMLKHELASLGSLVLSEAYACAVPAGTALAVDRESFAQRVTARLASHPRIAVHRTEQRVIPPDRRVIVATGPLTSAGLQDALTQIVGPERLSFFDAASPIVDAQTIDPEFTFLQSRYDRGAGADYLNCLLTREQYETFVSALASAERVIHKDFESADLFGACQPLEEIARQGIDALRFGPMKPIGLVDPRTSTRPWAVLQLRPENAASSCYNLVGCQTNLTFSEQRKVFSLVPGLQHAEFLRYGVMHRNTFVDAPRLLDAWLRVKRSPLMSIAGQLVGTEGYLEAAAGGLVAALGIASWAAGVEAQPLPRETALGALIAYATDPATYPYQPMHVNFGLLPPAPSSIRSKSRRRAVVAQHGREALAAWRSQHQPLMRRAEDALRELRPVHE